MKIKVDNITYVVPLYIALFVYKNRILLKLKRVKRFIKRAIKEFGLGFLVTLFLFGIYLIIAVIVDPVINQTDKIYKTIWNCTPMLYTGIVIAFTTSVINHEKHRHRCLKKQWLFYSDISFTYTDYIVSVLKIIKVKVTYDCLKNNENVEEAIRFINTVDFAISSESIKNVKTILHYYLERLDDVQKIWLGYEFIDFDINFANETLRDLKKIIKALIKKQEINKDDFIDLVSESQLFLSNFRKPWRQDEDIHNNISCILKSGKCVRIG